MSSFFYPPKGSGIAQYANVAALPATAADGTLAETLDTYSIYVFEIGSMTWVRVAGPGLGSGTVTSVAQTVPAFLSISGSPITTSGTLAIGLSGTALPVANGGTGSTTAFTQGSVVFAGASGVYSQDNSKFFWDDTNHSLGIGIATPGASHLTIQSDAMDVSADWQLRLYNPNSDASGNDWRFKLGGPGIFDGTMMIGVGAFGSAYVMQFLPNGVSIGTNKVFYLQSNAALAAYENGNYFINFETSTLVRISTGSYISFQHNGVENSRIDSSGRFGIGTTTPTAFVNIQAGTATANTAPIKLTSGTNLTTIENGAIEFDGNAISFSANSKRSQLNPLTADLTAQSAGVSSILSVTSPNDSAAHQYRVGGYVNVTAIAVDILNYQVTFTDLNNTSRTLTFAPQGSSSVSLATTGFNGFPTMDIMVKANTAITTKTILATGGGSVTYDCGSSIQQLN